MEHVARPPAAAHQERSLIESVLHYYRLLLRYRWLIIVTTGVAALLAVAFSMLTILLPADKSPLPNEYTASALLLVQQDQSTSAASMLASLGLAEMAGGTTSNPGQIAVTVLNSRSIIDRLVEEFDIAAKEGISGRSNLRGYFTNGFETSYNKTTNTMTVSYTHTDAVFASAVVNRAVELLDGWFANSSGTASMLQKQVVERKLIEVEGEIAKLEESIATFQRTHGALRAEDLGAAQTEMLTELQTQLMEKELAIKNYQSYSNIEDPALRKLKIERDNIVEMMERIQAGDLGAGKRVPAQEQLPDLALEFTHLTLSLEIQRRIFETLSQQYEVIKISGESEPVFTIMELAETPDEKSGPSRGKICMMVTALAFFASIAFAFAHNAIVNATKKKAG